MIKILQDSLRSKFDSNSLTDTERIDFFRLIEILKKQFNFEKSWLYEVENDNEFEVNK